MYIWIVTGFLCIIYETFVDNNHLYYQQIDCLWKSHSKIHLVGNTFTLISILRKPFSS